MVGIIDDRHLAPPKKRPQADAMAKPFLIAVLVVADEQLDRQRRLIRRQADQLQIRMIAGRKHPARFTLAARLERRIRRFRCTAANAPAQWQTAACRRPAAPRTDTCWPAAQTSTSGETAPLHHHVQVFRATFETESSELNKIGPIIAEKLPLSEVRAAVRFSPHAIVGYTGIHGLIHPCGSNPIRMCRGQVDGNRWPLPNRKPLSSLAPDADRAVRFLDRMVGQRGRCAACGLAFTIAAPPKLTTPCRPTQLQQQHRQPNRKSWPKCPSTSASTAVFATRGCTAAPTCWQESEMPRLRRPHRHSAAATAETEKHAGRARRRAIRAVGCRRAAAAERTDRRPAEIHRRHVPQVRHADARQRESSRPTNHVPRLRHDQYRAAAAKTEVESRRCWLQMR